MVLMGINRLVVTDGDIEAKVLFQLDTKDKVTKKRQDECELRRPIHVSTVSRAAGSVRT